METTNVVQRLLRSRKVWVAIVGLLQTVIFSAVPNFPEEVWQSINVLLITLIGAIAVEDAAAKFTGSHFSQQEDEG